MRRLHNRARFLTGAMGVTSKMEIPAYVSGERKRKRRKPKQVVWFNPATGATRTVAVRRSGRK